MIESKHILKRKQNVPSVLMVMALTIFGWATPGLASHRTCVVTDNSTGTIDIPPAGCDYTSPQEVFMIIDGLPAGTRIELIPTFSAFHSRFVEDGGNLGGQREVFDAVMVLELVGTGELNGFRRVLSLQTSNEWQSAPRTPGDPVQNFDTDFTQLQGALFGDPDFAQLQLTAGTAFGLFSPGHASLRDRGDGTFYVDSFFDVSYQIDFVGAPGGALDGLSGSTTGTTRLEAQGIPVNRRCIEPDNGSGTITLPPAQCSHTTSNIFSSDFFIIDGLPPGTTIELEPLHYQFICTGAGGSCSSPGGNLGGEREVFDSTLRLYLKGTGALAGFRRTLRMPLTVATDSGPRTPGDPVQAFVTELADMQGTLTGDPDFASLSITAGSSNGLPGPGQTTLQDLGNGTFQVDSFFDINYRIDFEGAPGGSLDGMSGSTTTATRLDTRRAIADAVAQDIGTGTTTLPPEPVEYTDPEDGFRIINGLPPGITINIDSAQFNFFCVTPGCGQSGGALGGDMEVFNATFDLVLTSIFTLGGFNRTIQIPLSIETHSAPRTPGDAVQRFNTDLFSMQGQINGDPDFDQLSITAGSNNSMPSPGYTTLTDQGNGTFLVDSFFDISYQIDFVGAPGGQLDGLSGSTQDSTRVEASQRNAAPPHNVTIVLATTFSDATDFDFSGDLGDFTLDDNADMTLSNRRLVNNLPAGSYTVSQAVPSGWSLAGWY